MRSIFSCAYIFFFPPIVVHINSTLPAAFLLPTYECTHMVDLVSEERGSINIKHIQQNFCAFHNFFSEWWVFFSTFSLVEQVGKNKVFLASKFQNVKNKFSREMSCFSKSFMTLFFSIFLHSGKSWSFIGVCLNFFYFFQYSYIR